MTSPLRARTPAAVVLGGDSNALSAARTLSRAGVTVHGIGPERSPARHSRAIETFGALGVGREALSHWLDWLLRADLRAVLLPCSDDGLELLARNRAVLEEHGYVLPEMDDAVAFTMLDKERAYERARAAGIPAPRTVDAVDRPSVEAALEVLTLPCALKPRRSRSSMPPGLAGKAIVVSTAEELLRTYDALAAHDIDVIVTEIVEGGDERLCQYWCYATREGRVLLELTKRKLRQHPPSFGTGCYQATGWDTEVADIGRRFVRELGVVGFSSTEFKRSSADGRLTLIECNYRLIDSNALGIVAGVDAARIVYDRALGRPVPVQPRPRDDVGFWHPVRDARAMREYRRRGETDLRTWARSVLRPHVFPYFSWTDPAPSAMVALNRVGGRLRPAQPPAPEHAAGVA